MAFANDSAKLKGQCLVIRHCRQAAKRYPQAENPTAH